MKNLGFPRVAHTTDFLMQFARILYAEAKAIEELAQNIPIEAFELGMLLSNCSGKIVFSGMGKSGHIGRKLAATFSSLGMPAFFMHPAEALHGDLGMVQKGDVCIALSKSGNGVELASMLGVLGQLGVSTVLICCNRGSLVSRASLVVCLPFTVEACRHNLVPSSSSTMMLAFGDALAIALSEQRQFSKSDFGRLHPAGSLGKTVHMTVYELMHQKDELAFLSLAMSFQEALVTITAKRLGVGIVVGSNDHYEVLLGIVTDGDLRRVCSRGKEVFDLTVEKFMFANPQTIESTMLAQDALRLMEDRSITSLVVVEKGEICGLVHIHDLVKAGISI